MALVRAVSINSQGYRDVNVALGRKDKSSRGEMKERCVHIDVNRSETPRHDTGGFKVKVEAQFSNGVSENNREGTINNLCRKHPKYSK